MWLEARSCGSKGWSLVRLKRREVRNEEADNQDGKETKFCLMLFLTEFISS